MKLEWSRLFPGTFEQADAAGHFARQLAGTRHDAAAIEVVTRELARNAVLHTASGRADGYFTIRANVAPAPGRYQLQVIDLGGMNEPTPIEASSDDDSPPKSGLDIVARLCRDWGIEGDQRGRAVWARW